MADQPQVLVIGSGMIVHDQILPSLYHMQRLGHIGEISVCATRSTRIRDLVNEPVFKTAFPGRSFTAYPDASEDEANHYPELYREVLAKLPPRQVVIVAIPDQLHYEVIKAALEADQHVLAVKPLVLTYAHAEELAKLGRERGLFVGVEYHKRFDRRNLDARHVYSTGTLGEFRAGEAKLIEPWLYRDSNFQNWFTCENTDPFTYIGCHYVDAVYFITGLRPTEVSVQGVKGAFPNGNVGYMWANGRVRFENDALLSVTTGLGYPDNGAGSNDQGMCLFCETKDNGATLKHDDQFRGVIHGGSDKFRFVNPDFFRLVAWPGEGLKPVGYGYDSVEANVLTAIDINRRTADVTGEQALEARRTLIAEVDDKGIIATPANSYINELVVEAVRLSILDDGARVAIEYGDSPGVKKL